MDVLGSTLKEKTNTWNKSFKERANRESEFYKMVELAAIDERQEDKERSMLKDVLKQLRKEREENSCTHRRHAAQFGGSVCQSL